MEPLFKLMLIRPAIKQDSTTLSINLTQNSSLQNALEEASKMEQPREELHKVAQNFVAGADFIGDSDLNPLRAQLTALAESLDRLEGQTDVSHTEVVTAITQAFGSDPTVLVQNKTLEDPMAKLRDSLLAIKQIQEKHNCPIEELTNQLRDLELILKVARDGSFPKNSTELRRYRRRSLQLPPVANLPSIVSTAELEEEWRKSMATAEAKRQKLAEDFFNKYQHLRKAIDELTNLSEEHFQTTKQELHEGFTLPTEFNPINALKNQMAYLETLSELNLKQFQAAIDRDNVVDPIKTQDLAGAISATHLAEIILTKSPSLLPGSPLFEPIAPSDLGFRLKKTAMEALSESTKAILKERKLESLGKPLDLIVEQLQIEIDATSRELEVLYGCPMQRSIKLVGDTLVTISTPIPSIWTNISIGFTFIPLPVLTINERIPHTRGKVVPVGIGDLIIVKQQLIGYEGADIAHIENVLKGERKQREHTRRQENEQFTFREIEVTTSEERELESTNRFEMARETHAIIKEDASLKAGLTVSGKYGPMVKFSASAEGSVSRSKEESIKSAAMFSQEVTQRSANKITERVLERTSLRVTNEVIEKNTHELNNVDGSGHISGVYQWVNKIYQAQMFNYGLRMIFEFMVPEPGSFLMEVLRTRNVSTVELKKPPEFNLKPDEVTEDNYSNWVRMYGATDVTPPPEIYKTKSHDFKAGGGGRKTYYNHSAQIAIDEGYEAIQGSVGRVVNTWGASNSVDIVLGRRPHRFVNDSDWIWTTSLDYERDSIPLALNTFNVSDVAIAVEVKCRRTERAMMKWRFETHAKLTTAYKARLAEYEEKLAAVQLQAGVAVLGKNPTLNLEIMMDELKKNCISILTDQHYDLFNAITIGSNGMPQINILEAEAEGAYVSFFEQAFEWDQITWVTYPYFWGRKSKWNERLAFEDPDPLFDQFLKAGYCRVSVPARPGFETAIEHFMTYGELWNGGPLPTITSPLYLRIAEEIAERSDRPGNEVPQGDPWLIRIPTTLVKLRDDDKLPEWRKNQQGEWTPV